MIISLHLCAMKLLKCGINFINKIVKQSKGVCIHNLVLCFKLIYTQFYLMYYEYDVLDISS